jgi:hypothetical protein
MRQNRLEQLPGTPEPPLLNAGNHRASARPETQAVSWGRISDERFKGVSNACSMYLRKDREGRVAVPGGQALQGLSH